MKTILSVLQSAFSWWTKYSPGIISLVSLYFGYVAFRYQQSQKIGSLLNLVYKPGIEYLDKLTSNLNIYSDLEVYFFNRSHSGRTICISGAFVTNSPFKIRATINTKRWFYIVNTINKKTKRLIEAHNCRIASFLVRKWRPLVKLDYIGYENLVNPQKKIHQRELENPIKKFKYIGAQEVKEFELSIHQIANVVGTWVLNNNRQNKIPKKVFLDLVLRDPAGKTRIVRLRVITTKGDGLIGDYLYERYHPNKKATS